MPDDHCGPQYNTRNLISQFSDQCPRPLTVDVPVHLVKNLVGDVLERNVKVFADFRITSHLVKHILREISGVGIMDP